MFQQPSYGFQGVVRHLIIINVLMFFGSYIILGNELRDIDGSFINLGRLQLAAFIPGSPYFQPYQIATHMFMHGSIGHIAFNMMSLYFFGPLVEMVWGHRRFLLYYLACGLGSYALHMGMHYWELQQMGLSPEQSPVPMLGASGAIFGVFVAFAWLYPDQVISLIFPPISLKAKYFVPILAAIDLFSGVSGRSTGIAHFAHLGGALIGFILILIWYKGGRRR
jgi:membrane associated rhomboid family serine protease